jgi:hypothetical protein
MILGFGSQYAAYAGEGSNIASQLKHWQLMRIKLSDDNGLLSNFSVKTNIVVGHVYRMSGSSAFNQIILINFFKNRQKFENSKNYTE